MKFFASAAFFVGLATTTSAFAQQLSSEDSATLFGVRQSIQQASISPDGSKFSYLAPVKGQGSALYVAALDGKSEPKPVLVASGDPERLGSCNWVAETRLVCSVFGTTHVEGTEVAYFSRLLGVDSDGENIKVLQQRGGAGERLGYDLYGGGVIDWLPGEDGVVLMARDYVPEVSTGTLLSSDREGLGVDRVDTRTLKSDTVERPRKDGSEYITDGHGNVRIMGIESVDSTGYDTGETEYFYRLKSERDWKPLSDGFNPYGVDPKLNVAYGLKKLDGRYAAYTVALDGSMKETLLFAHPKVDMNGFARIGRSERIVGVSYATDKPEVHYFDSALEGLANSLAKALPNLPLVQIVDSSVDESKLLLWAGSDTDPGRYYLFDRKARQLSELLPSRQGFENVQLAAVKPVSYPAADGTMVPGYLTLPPGKENAKGLPAIVMPHGGPGARDEWGFDWLSQFFANRGFAVLQPNFRGSAGYGDAWFQKNGFQNWRTAIGDVDDGGRWLVSQGIADPEKLAIVGWSYGGYAALQSAVTEPKLFKAAIAIAPVTDLEMWKEERRGWTDFEVRSRFVGSGPHIEEGSPARNAGKIRVPVLMFHGDMDRNVGAGQSRVMASRLEEAGVQSDLVIYEGRDHYLEDSQVRIDMLKKSEAFLRKALKL